MNIPISGPVLRIKAIPSFIATQDGWKCLKIDITLCLRNSPEKKMLLLKTSVIGCKISCLLLFNGVYSRQCRRDRSLLEMPLIRLCHLKVRNVQEENI